MPPHDARKDVEVPGKDVWLIDSGSEQDLISKAVTETLLHPRLPTSMSVHCASRRESGKAHTMLRPDGALIQPKVDGHVPHMDCSCEAESPLSAAATALTRVTILMLRLSGL